MNRKHIFVSSLLMVCYALFGFKPSITPHERIKEIAKEYKQYHLYKDLKVAVTDSAKYQWSQPLCIHPKGTRNHGYVIQRDSLFISEANEMMSPHGNKLYRLYIKSFDAYVNAKADQPEGQVIVKETWNVEEVVYDSLNRTGQQIRSSNDGKWYTPTTVSELFMMYKENESSANDKGWNYAVYSLEDNTKEPALLNDIKISSCIGCHKNTKYDRIFGVE